MGSECFKRSADLFDTIPDRHFHLLSRDTVRVNCSNKTERNVCKIPTTSNTEYEYNVTLRRRHVARGRYYGSSLDCNILVGTWWEAANVPILNNEQLLSASQQPFLIRRTDFLEGIQLSETFDLYLTTRWVWRLKSSLSHPSYHVQIFSCILKACTPRAQVLHSFASQ